MNNGFVRRLNPSLIGGVTPTAAAMQNRIQAILNRLGVQSEYDPLDLSALQPTGDEFPAGSTISFEPDGRKVLTMQAARDSAVEAENSIHADDGLPGFGINPDRPCQRPDHSPFRRR